MYVGLTLAEIHQKAILLEEICRAYRALEALPEGLRDDKSHPCYRAWEEACDAALDVRNNIMLEEISEAMSAEPGSHAAVLCATAKQLES
jgi:hypothetical protein